MRKLVGFTGLKGSGKDTAGECFVRHGYVKMSFAEPLKAMLKTLLTFRGYTDPEVVHRILEGDRKEMTSSAFMGKSPRHAMQTLGTEYGRNCIHEDLWIDTFKRRVQGSEAPIVVTDVRFPNEVEAIKSLGGVVFRVNRPLLDGRTYSDLHPSETQIGELDVYEDIENNFPTALDFQRWVEERFF